MENQRLPDKIQAMLKEYGISEDQLEGVEVTPEKVRKLSAFTPVEGRYSRYIKDFYDITSEKEWIKRRIFFSIEYFIALSERMDSYEGFHKDKKIVKHLTDDMKEALRRIPEDMEWKDYLQVQEIEKKSDHDLAAATDWLKYKVGKMGLGLDDSLDGFHFGLTSEDINLLVFSSMNRDILHRVMVPVITNMQEMLISYARSYEFIGAALTHGQPAEPTTMAKKLAFTINALNDEIKTLIDSSEHIVEDDKAVPVYKPMKFYGKLLGAVGNLNDLKAAYPDIDWLEFHRKVVDDLGFRPLDVAHQTSNFTDIRQVYTSIEGLSQQMVKLSNDFWDLVSSQWFKKVKKKGLKGSSSMPNKFNPWEIEGGIKYMKKGIMQLDFTWKELVDYHHEGDMGRSILQRDIGDDYAKVVIGFMRVLNELSKYEPYYDIVNLHLENNPGLVGGAAQTVLKREGVPGDAYRMIQGIMINPDGSYVSKEDFKRKLTDLMAEGKIPESAGQEILNLADPKNNIGYAPRITGETLPKAEATVEMLKNVYHVEEAKGVKQ